MNSMYIVLAAFPRNAWVRISEASSHTCVGFETIPSTRNVSAE